MIHTRAFTNIKQPGKLGHLLQGLDIMGGRQICSARLLVSNLGGCKDDKALSVSFLLIFEMSMLETGVYVEYDISVGAIDTSYEKHFSFS